MTFSYSGASNMTLDDDGTARTITLGGDLISTANAGTVTFATGLTLDINGNRTIDAPNDGGTLVFDSKITGTGNFNISSGTGDVELKNTANDFVGAVNIGFVRSLKYESIGNVSGGATALGSPTSVANGTITFGNGLSYTEFEHTGSSASTTDRVIELNVNSNSASVNFINSGSGKLTFTSDITHKNDQEHSINFVPTGDIEWSGVLADAATQNLNVTQNKDGGTTILSGTNTYDGTTTISNGVLKISNNSALGSTTGGTTITNNAVLHLNGVSVGAEAITLSSDGSNNGGIYADSGTNSIAGNITLGNRGQIQVDNNGTSITVSGITDLNGQELRLDSNATSTGSTDIIMSGKITGSGTLTVNSGKGDVILNNDTSDFDAPISLGYTRSFDFSSIKNVSGGASALGNPTSVANGTITVGNGSSFTHLEYIGTSDSTTDRILKLASTTGDITLTNSGTGSLTWTSALGSDSDNARDFTIATTNGDVAFTGAITDPGTNTITLSKSGAQTLTLSGSNTYTGGLTVTDGTLILGHSNALGGTGGNGALTIGGASLEISSGASVASGTLTITSNNTEIRGLGTFSRNVTIDDTGNNFAQVQAGISGSPVGTLGLGAGGTSTLETGGTYIWNINDFTGTAGADPGWSKLAFTGTLDVQSTAISPFTIGITGYSGASLGTPSNFTWGTSYDFEVISATSITNFDASYFNLDATNLFGDHWRWSIYQSGNSLFLRYDAVPEPGTWVMIIGIGFFLSFRLFKRKLKTSTGS